MEKNTKVGKQNFTDLVWLLLIGFLFWTWFKVSGKKKEPYITTRKALAKQYDIDLKTFNKWVQLLADPDTLPYAKFTKQRGLTQRQHDYLIELFGLPAEGKTKYSKFDIVASDEEGIGHNDYRDVRQSIEQWPDKCIVSREIYAQLNFFPPHIGRELKRKMN